jgi:hypothetical protein
MANPKITLDWGTSHLRELEYYWRNAGRTEELRSWRTSPYCAVVGLLGSKLQLGKCAQGCRILSARFNSEEPVGTLSFMSQQAIGRTSSHFGVLRLTVEGAAEPM